MESSVGLFPVPPEVETKPVDAGGVRAEWQWRAGVAEDAVLMYLHGGGYALGSINTHRSLTAGIAQHLAGRVLSVDYRLAPEHPCPAAIEDAVAAYRFLLNEGAKRIVIAGDSAGGGLTLATLVALREAGLPQPVGAWCISPWTDLAGTGESAATKVDEDVMIKVDGLRENGRIYAPGGDVNDPRATVLNADLRGLAPLLIQVGTAEVLLDDSTRLATKAAAANVNVRLETWPNMPHVWHIFAGMLSEARDAVAVGIKWANRQLG
jgi:acetyl esterase/lipase